MAGDPKVLRKYIFDYFLENARAPVLEEIMARFSLGRMDAANLLAELETARHVVRVPGTNRILMANPFSALDTPFRVSTEGRGYFGACAWDAVAFHVMLGNDTRVDSFCHHCAGPIVAEFSQGKRVLCDPEEPLVYLSIPAKNWWNDIVTTCANHMVFFASRGHLDEWLAANPGTGQALTIEQTLQISGPIYKDKMKEDYARPSKDQLTRHWSSMGLKGPFWEL